METSKEYKLKDSFIYRNNLKQDAADNKGTYRQ